MVLLPKYLRIAMDLDPEQVAPDERTAQSSADVSRSGFLRHLGQYHSKGQFSLLLLLSLIKIVALFLLLLMGVYRPFVGSNATDHYLPIADRLLAESRFNGPDSRPDSKVPPGYPLMIAAIKAVCGEFYLQVIVYFQILIDLATAWGILALGRLLGSERAGLLAAIAWLLYPPEMLIATWITAETAFTGLLVLSVMLLLRGMKRGRNSEALAAGVILGFATYFRASCLYFPLLFLLVAGLGRGRRGALQGLCVAVGCYSIVLPWTIRNYLVLNDRIVMSVGGGSVMLQGSDARFFTIAGKRKHYAAVYREAAEAGMTKPEGNRESAIDGWLMKIGLRQYGIRLRERPASFGPFFLHKVARLTYGTESGVRTNQLFLGLCTLIIAPPAIWQIWRWRRENPEATLLFGSLLGYFTVLHVITLPEYRYLHPVFPLLLLAAAYRVVHTRCRPKTMSV
jgi:4-amino-4-deoxy-L-arabinose transferase-like glycosyltransferase